MKLRIYIYILVIFFESKAFHIRYAVSDDFIKVHDFSNLSRSLLAGPDQKLSSLQITSK